MQSVCADYEVSFFCTTPNLPMPDVERVPNM